MDDRQVQQEVNTAVFFDRTVDSVAIVAEVNDGVVTLRGTVGSQREKTEAENDVLRVAGVTAVHNELEVTGLDAVSRDDADLRGVVLQALALDMAVPTTIDATVEDSWVTLTGTATELQRDQAQSVVARQESVKGITNKIRTA